MALQYEPYEEGRARIRWVLDLLEGKGSLGLPPLSSSFKAGTNPCDKKIPN